MKKTSIILVALLFFAAGCGRSKQSTNKLIIVDVTKSYPKKDLILQDFLDVEYIPLETNDEFITQGIVMDIGRENIIVRNRTQDGDIYIFDRHGKGVRKINRMGQGGEEYLVYLSGGFILDEDNDEMYINNGMRFSFIVYDLRGNFKRIVRYKEGPFILNAFNFDKDNILCVEEFWPGLDVKDHRNSFFLISKQNGSVKEVEIPFEKKLSIQLTKQDEAGNIVDAIGPRNCLITSFNNNWIIAEPSADTVYSYLPDERLHPFIVRTPSVQSMNPEIFLFPGVLTGDYCFMQTVKKEANWMDRTLTTANLVYDNQEKKIYECTVYNSDFSGRTEDMSVRVVNSNIFYFILEAPELVEAYGKGQLKGKLKEIAAELDEESNPVIMLVKRKNS